MLTDLVKAGQMVELQALHKNFVPEGDEEVEGQEPEQEGADEKGKIYRTEVFDVLSEEKLEIMMPFEKGQIVLLTVDGEYELWFRVDDMIYQCFARVLDRYKSDNIYVAMMELTSNLKKHQRREFFRLDCMLSMSSRNLEAMELQALEQGHIFLQKGLPLNQNIIVDMSGGGLRFLMNGKYEPGSFIYCTYHLESKKGRNQYDLIGKVLYVREMDDKPGSFEHRIQYVNIDVDDRENIIKYIFEEERRQLHRARNK